MSNLTGTEVSCGEEGVSGYEGKARDLHPRLWSENEGLV